MKALLKKLKLNNQHVSLSKYYKISQLAQLEDVRDQKAYSPLHEENIELQCNSDEAIFHAFQELILETYQPMEMQNLKIEQSNRSIDASAAKKDIDEINCELKRCKKSSYLFPYFEIKSLSTANWFRD